jgi:hypothetical protein
MREKSSPLTFNRSLAGEDCQCYSGKRRAKFAAARSSARIATNRMASNSTAHKTRSSRRISSFLPACMQVRRDRRPYQALVYGFLKEVQPFR